MFLVSNYIFCLFDFEFDFLTFKMTSSHKNNKRNGLCENEVLNLFLALFVEKP